MSQEFVLPLALAWRLDMPGNPYRGDAELRRWIAAAIRFAARTAHRDGSCDDYYPNERAVGASAFSLLAILDSLDLVVLAEDDEIARFVQRRGRWLARHRESGQLSNHEALVVAILVRLAARDPAAWEPHLKARLARLLGWQSREGWFNEYGGADPGYLSLTIGLLADVDRRRPDLGLRPAIVKAVDFLAAFVHPDGSVGGEYASRGTRSFFPHGLEIAGRWLPRARAINDLALRQLVTGLDPCFSDDRIVGHHLWSWMLAWRDWQTERPPALRPPRVSRVFPEARLAVAVAGELRLYCGWSRGGAFKFFDEDALFLSDTGPALRLSNGRVAVTHLEGARLTASDERHLLIEGRMAWANTALLTPVRLIALRLLMMTVGRLFPDGVRALLQHFLVTRARAAPFRFRRLIEWDGACWRVTDTIVPERGWRGVATIGLGGFQTSTATAMARVWEPAQLQPWMDWTALIAGRTGCEPLIVSRTLPHERDRQCAA